MGFINNIRKRSGVAIGIIAASLGLFLLGGDLLSPNSVLMGGNDQNVGSISGSDISYQQYQVVLAEVENNFRMQRGTAPTEADMANLQEQAWNQLIYDVAFKNEFSELGIEVTEEEKIDMVQGNNIHPSLRQAFTNPQTGQFDKASVLQFLKSLDAFNPQMGITEQEFAQRKNQFLTFEKQMTPDRMRTKHSNLLKSSVYVTKAEAKKNYEGTANSVNVNYLYVPYYSILDSIVEVSDEEMKAYLQAHKDEFESEASVSMDYVVFSIKPSKEDSSYVKEEISELKEEFIATTNDSLFARANADNFVPATYQGIGGLPLSVQNDVANLDSGMVVGPYLDQDRFVLYKVSGISEDTLYSARASHILFKSKTQSDEDLAIAKEECEKVLASIKAGESFEEMAKIHGTDATASKGGDLGWFGEGRMVAEFNDAVFDATTEGLLSAPVKTNFGYHIINITALKTNKTFKISSVDRTIYTSDDTRDIAYRQADVFAGKVSNVDEFDEAIAADNLQKLESKNLKAKDRTLRGAGQARQAIRWGFNDAEVGSVSPVFELDDVYIVALLTAKSEKGSSNLEDVKDQVMTKVRNEKKADIIAAKLAESSGSLNDRSTAYGSQALVNSSPNLNLNSTSITGIGFDPTAIGIASSLAQGETSEIYKGESGVIIFEATAVTPAAAKEDYSAEKLSLSSKVSSRVEGLIFEAIKDGSSIEDNRVKYY